MRKRVLVISIMLVLCLSSFSYPLSASAQDDLADVNVLVIIATSFGWNYFDIVEILQGWGVSVTTVASSTSLTVASCVNREPRPVTADILVGDLDNETLDQYDALVIPSGGHWDGLCSRRVVRNLLAIAHERGLAIATMCIGNRVVCRSNLMLNGSKVAYYGMTNSEMRSKGATVVSGAVVVSDNRIITGGSGSGPPDGYQGAPTYLVMVELIKEILGYSYVQDTSLEPQEGELDTEFQLTVSIHNPCIDLEGVNSSEITEISAIVYSKSNSSLVQTVALEQIYGSSFEYIANFTAPGYGVFGIDIEIEDAESVVEVERDATSFEVLDSPPQDFSVDPILVAAVVLIPAVIGIIYVFVRRRGIS